MYHQWPELGDPVSLLAMGVHCTVNIVFSFAFIDVSDREKSVRRGCI